MERELIVSSDLAADALSLWEAVSPRKVVLAGGSTPREMYRRLWQERRRLRLSRVEYFFGDERCVPPDHPDSNFRMANDSLLSALGSGAFVHRMPGESCDARKYESVVRGVDFDLVLLGLGADGHTCSLFPRDAALDERERLVVRVERPDHARLTLTFPAVNSARVGVFLVAGAAKGDALAGLMAGDDSLPAARVECERVVVLADFDAAAAADLGT